MYFHAIQTAAPPRRYTQADCWEVLQRNPPRGLSRLLVLDRRSGAVEHAGVAELAHYLREGDLLVVNDTRVFAARLTGHRVPSGGAVECLLLSLPAGAAGEAIPPPA